MNGKIGTLSSKDIENIHKDHELRKDDGELFTKCGLIIILDMLGWKKLMKSEMDTKRYFSKVNNLKDSILDMAHRFENTETNVEVLCFSDTIMILSNGDHPISDLTLLNITSEFLAEAFGSGFIFRGTVGYGNYFVNKAKNAYLGNSIYSAFKKLEETEWAGITFTQDAEAHLLGEADTSCLQEIGIISYSNIPYKINLKEFKTKHMLTLCPKLDKFYYVPYIASDGSVNFGFLLAKIMGTDKNLKEKFHNTLDYLDYASGILNSKD